MADNIKDFVKKQAGGALSIGVPKQRPTSEEVKSVVMEPVKTPEITPVPEIVTESAPKGKVGRPKSEIEKVKLSLYIPAEAKEKLIRIQHNNYRQNLNDVMIEAINDFIKKYE